MLRSFAGFVMILVAVLAFSPLAFAQMGQAPSRDNRPFVPADGWTGLPAKQLSKAEIAAPAPRHDISGIWDPGNVGLQVTGAGAMPEDGKPEHEPPYTPEGLAVLKLTKPTNGVRTVLTGETNDPVVACDPQGFPREDLYNVRVTQILQTPERIIALYEFGKVWRSIWTDGRDFPKEAAARWYGYSIGKWEDDDTFVVQTRGTDARTWVDRSGRPHSADLQVEERFHRVDYGTFEFTVIIKDPKMYTKSWVALDRLRFKLQSPNFDVTEWLCSPTDLEEYNKMVGDPVSNTDKK